MSNSWPGTWEAVKDPLMAAPERWAVYADDLPVGHKMPAECTGPDAERNAKLIALVPGMLEKLLALFEGVNAPDDLKRWIQYHKVDRRTAEPLFAMAKLGRKLKEAP